MEGSAKNTIIDLVPTIIDNMRVTLETFRPVRFKLAESVRLKAIDYIFRSNLFGLPQTQAQEQVVRSFILTTVFEAGRIQGIRDERARRAAKNGKSEK